MASSNPTRRGGTRHTPGAQMRQLSWNQTSFFSFDSWWMSSIGTSSSVTVLTGTVALGISLSVLVKEFLFFCDFLLFFEPGLAGGDASSSLINCRVSGFFLENHIGSGRTYIIELRFHSVGFKLKQYYNCTFYMFYIFFLITWITFLFVYFIDWLLITSLM